MDIANYILQRSNLENLYHDYVKKYKNFISYENFLSLYDEQVISTINEKKLPSKSKLYQSLIEFCNPLFKQKIKEIANQLCNDILLKTPDDYDTSVPTLATDDNNYFIFKEFSLNNSAEWVDKIITLMTFEQEDEDFLEYSVIKNNDIYINHNGQQIKIEKPENKHVPFICILLYINKRNKHNIDELYSILMHEIHHAFKRVFTEQHAEDINKSRIKSDELLKTTNGTISINAPYMSMRDYDIHNFLSNIDEHILYHIFLENAYLLNNDEIEASLENIQYDIKINKTMIDILTEQHTDADEILDMVSKNYRIYERYLKLFNRINAYVPAEIKEKFENAYLSIFSNMYDKQFKTFNDLIEYHKQHFKQFLRRSIKIYLMTN